MLSNDLYCSTIFKFAHLPEHLQKFSRPFAECADEILHYPTVGLSGERTKALIRLLDDMTHDRDPKHGAGSEWSVGFAEARLWTTTAATERDWTIRQRLALLVQAKDVAVRAVLLSSVEYP